MTPRAPDFFLVGHPKCGTSAMCQMLRTRPDIYIGLKEPGFFVPELRDGRGGNRRPHTLADYLAMYAPAAPGQLAGDATPWYLNSPTAAAEIAELQPAARVIAIFREPASFLHSLHAQHLQDHVETEPDLRKALALETSRREGRNIPLGCWRPQDLRYSDFVKYAEQLGRFRAVFPPEQILVLIYEEFRQDNEGTMREVLRFLGAKHTEPVGPLQANPTVRIRLPRLYEQMHRLSFGEGRFARAAKPPIKSVTSKSLRHRASAVQYRMQSTEPRHAEESLVLELRSRFRGEVAALSDHLDRDLSAFWGYA